MKLEFINATQDSLEEFEIIYEIDRVEKRHTIKVSELSEQELRYYIREDLSKFSEWLWKSRKLGSEIKAIYLGSKING